MALRSANINDPKKAGRLFGEAVAKIKGKNLAGLLAAGHIVERKSKETTPYETGNLEGSHYVVSNEDPDNPIVEVGLTAEYAPAVHEKIDQKIKKAGRRPMFLTLAITENADILLETIARRLRV